jgi:hypothetical protein
MITKKWIDWISAPLTRQCNAMEFILFFSPRAKTKETPTHKTAHLQTAASQPCKPKFAKELFFCRLNHTFFNSKQCIRFTVRLLNLGMENFIKKLTVLKHGDTFLPATPYSCT